MPSPTRNLSELVDGLGAIFGGTVSSEIRDYSNFGDTIDLSVNFPSNLHTRMLDGNDIVTLSNIVVGGFSNKINGNRGDDRITSKVGSLTRDFILGGSENDIIDLSNSISGADWQNGNNGNDIITGAASKVKSILRGGSENDTIIISGGADHIAVGDLGIDSIDLTAAGNPHVVLRTDNGAAPANKVEADSIISWSGLLDKAYVPGVNSTADLFVEASGADTYLFANTFTNGTIGKRYIAKFVAKTPAAIQADINGGKFIVGALANSALAALNPTNFLNDPNLGGIFV